MIFGDARMSIEELSEVLRKRVPALAGGDSNRDYTKGVKEALDEIAKKHRPRMFCTDRARNMKEFLLDFVLWNDAPKNQRAVLGVESEWGNPRDYNPESRAGQVMDDFEKLLVFKAPLKLILFCADNDEMRYAIHAGIERYIANFSQHVEGEQYLFMEFTGEQCYRYKWLANQNGLCDSAALLPMDAESGNILNRRKSATAGVPGTPTK